MKTLSLIFWLWILGVICLAIFYFVVVFQDLKNKEEKIRIKDVVSKMDFSICIGSWLLLLYFFSCWLGEISIWNGTELPKRDFQAFTKIGNILTKVYVPVEAKRSLKKQGSKKTIYISKLIIVEFLDAPHYDTIFGVTSVEFDSEVFYRDIEYTSETYEPGVSGFPVYLSRSEAVKFL